MRRSLRMYPQPETSQVLHHGDCAGDSVLGSDSRPQVRCPLTHRLVPDGVLNALRPDGDERVPPNRGSHVVQVDGPLASSTRSSHSSTRAAKRRSCSMGKLWPARSSTAKVARG